MELSIKTEHFNPKFLYINRNNRHSTFFNIFYRTPSIVLNNLVFQTPWMDAPIGICQYDNDEDRKKDKYYLDLSFNGCQYDPEIKNFYRIISNIDNFIIDYLDKHKDYLGLSNKQYIYNKQIRHNKNNPKFPPTIKLKIFKRTTKILNLDNELIPFDAYPKSKAQALIKCNGLWSYNNRFGLSWKVVKVNIKTQEQLATYPFIDSEEHESDHEVEEVDETNTEETFIDDHLVGSELSPVEKEKIVDEVDILPNIEHGFNIEDLLDHDLLEEEENNNQFDLI